MIIRGRLPYLSDAAPMTGLATNWRKENNDPIIPVNKKKIWKWFGLNDTTLINVMVAITIQEIKNYTFLPPPPPPLVCDIYCNILNQLKLQRFTNIMASQLAGIFYVREWQKFTIWQGKAPSDYSNESCTQ